MVRHGGSSAGSYLANPTSPIPSHCASIVVTSTVRVNPILTCRFVLWHSRRFVWNLVRDFLLTKCRFFLHIIALTSYSRVLIFTLHSSSQELSSFSYTMLFFLHHDVVFPLSVPRAQCFLRQMMALAFLRWKRLCRLHPIGFTFCKICQI